MTQAERVPEYIPNAEAEAEAEYHADGLTSKMEEAIGAAQYMLKEAHAAGYMTGYCACLKKYAGKLVPEINDANGAMDEFV